MKTRYFLKVNNEEITADYEPDFLNLGHAMQVEFHGAKPNPISETGYRSHITLGTGKDHGITNDNAQEELQELAQRLAAEEAARRLKVSRKRK